MLAYHTIYFPNFYKHWKVYFQTVSTILPTGLCQNLQFHVVLRAQTLLVLGREWGKWDDSFIRVLRIGSFSHSLRLTPETEASTHMWESCIWYWWTRPGPAEGQERHGQLCGSLVRMQRCAANNYEVIFNPNRTRMNWVHMCVYPIINNYIVYRYVYIYIVLWCLVTIQLGYLFPLVITACWDAHKHRWKGTFAEQPSIYVIGKLDEFLCHRKTHPFPLILNTP